MKIFLAKKIEKTTGEIKLLILENSIRLYVDLNVFVRKKSKKWSFCKSNDRRKGHKQKLSMYRKQCHMRKATAKRPVKLVLKQVRFFIYFSFLSQCVVYDITSNVLLKGKQKNDRSNYQ